MEYMQMYMVSWFKKKQTFFFLNFDVLTFLDVKRRLEQI